VGITTAPSSAREALDMVRAGLGYLAAADAAELVVATRAECLRELEQADAALTAARAFVLAGFTAAQGYADDADYSARSWLIHKTHITRGAAVGHTASAKRTATHPKVLAALAAGQLSESAGRMICLWTAKLPEKFQDS
jgi:hypothetical protein